MNKNWMHQISNIIVIPITLIFFISPSVFAWNISSDFESGIVGQVAMGSNALDYAGSVTTISGTLAHSGSKSIKMAWDTGMNGWGACHGEINFPSRVSEGGEVWFRAYTYFQPGWQWNEAQTKFMRLKTASGHLSLMAKSGIFYLSNEINDYDSSWQSPIQITPIANGQWICLEIYVRFSTTNGIIRLWKDGILFAEDRSPTLKSGETAYLAYLMNTWNSPGSPKSQIQYFDNIVLTNERPFNRDSAGNYMIGPIGQIGTPPLAPTGVKATIN